MSRFLGAFQVPFSRLEVTLITGFENGRYVVIMQRAFLLINVELEGGADVMRGLEGIPEVKEAYPLYGVYDIIAKIEADSESELKEIISQKIRRLDKVRSTMTMIVM